MRGMEGWKRVLVGMIGVMLMATWGFGAEGGLEMGTIEKIRDEFQMDPYTRAMYNAITNNDASKLALNRDVLREHNELFSHKLKTKGITNQKSSGRCWLFAGLNIMRPKVIEKYNLKSFEFSQNYLAFYDKLEKANRFLEYIIEFRDRDPLDREMEILLRGPWGDGGWWEYMVDLIEKYGVVPKEIMPETNSSGNTKFMNRVITWKLRSGAAEMRKMHQDGKSVKALRKVKEGILKDVYRMLVMNLGEPPAEFTWRYETADSVVSDEKVYTPTGFYQEFVGVDLREWVSIFDDPTKEYGKHYQLSMTRNMYDQEDVHYANVDVQTLKDIAVAALMDSELVWFACDVGKDQDSKLGIMAVGLYDFQSIYNTDWEMSKAEQVMYRNTSPNHAMAFIGVDMKDDKPVKWLVENSWGKDRGKDGLWTLYDTWFDEYVYNIIVQKKYVPQDILTIYDQPVIVVPPWDPMYEMVK